MADTTYHLFKAVSRAAAFAAGALAAVLYALVWRR